MTAAPFVSILVPARNEASDIERCIRAVLAQDHPHDRMELVLVDGGSVDSTGHSAAVALGAGDVAWRIVDNARGTTPSNLNAGLAVAMGDIVCRVDARSVVPPDYVRLCVETLGTRSDVAVTGGAQVAVARDDTATAVGIARSLNNRFAMGGARYRAGALSGPTDTVYLGAFRTEQLRAAGGWDEALLTNQDYDLNRRMRRFGTVYFDARLRVGYVPRPDLRALWRQYHRFGRWKVRYWRHTGDRPRPRQVLLMVIAPAVAVLGLGAVRGTRGRRLARAVIGGVAVGSLAAVERNGSSGPPGSPKSRAISSVALVTIAAAWSSGVYAELLVRLRAGSAPSVAAPATVLDHPLAGAADQGSSPADEPSRRAGHEPEGPAEQ